MLFIDIETRGCVPVTTHGLYRHADDTALDLLVLSYAIGDGPVQSWRHKFGSGKSCHVAAPIPTDLRAAILAPSVPIVAWNAAYERVVLRRVLPSLAPADDRYICAAALARAHNLPGSLDACSRYLLPVTGRKGKAAAWMWDASNPMEDSDLRAYEDHQVAYCERDVAAMRDIWKMLLDPTKAFREQYLASETINDRGLMFDVDMIDAAKRLAPHVTRDMQDTLDAATGGGVKLRGPSLKNWLLTALPPDLFPALTVKRKRKTGLRWWTEEKQSTDKGVRAELLSQLDERGGYYAVRAALAAFDEANKASVTKYVAAENALSRDHRLRGLYVMNGASTGRYSSTKVQVHNLPRSVPKDFTAVRDALLHAPARAIPGQIGMTVNHALSQCIRPSIIAPPGKCLVWADWKAIEARTLPWLADDAEAERILDVFRNDGDIYEVAARDIYGIEDVSPEQRQVGKVAVLALGFGGGVPALQAMARAYGLALDDTLAARVVDEWRDSNAWAGRFWDALMLAANRAIDNPGSGFTAGRITYVFAPKLLRGTLLAILPDNRFIAYPHARRETVERFDREYLGIAFDHPNYGVSELTRTIAVENVTQAAAASVLRESVVTLSDIAVGHTHDEILAEVDEDNVGSVIQRMKNVMSKSPSWAPTLPLAVDIGSGYRYKIPRGSDTPG